MTTTKCSLKTLCLVAALSAGASYASNAGANTADEHKSTSLRSADGRSPRVLVAGPAVLLHVDFDEQEDLMLYTVQRRSGTDADCAAAPAVGAVRLRAGRSNHLNLAVGVGQLVCVTAPHDHVSLLWHARKDEAQPAPAAASTFAFHSSEQARINSAKR